jgi:hypothetical protein
VITGAISGPQTERQEILRTADELLAQIEFSCLQEGSKRTKGKRRHHGASGLHLPPVTSQEPGPQSVLGRAKDHLTVSCLVTLSVGASLGQYRAIVAHNIRHYVLLDGEYRAKGQTHFGIPVCDQVPFRELLRRTMRCLSRKSDADIRNRVVWLQDFK